MNFRLFTILILLAIFFPATLPANDSIASIASGSISLEKSDGISLDYEKLVIGRQLIRVRLEFKNQTKADITTQVAFVMPDIEIYASSDAAINITAENPMRFSTTVDGKSVVFQIERKQLTQNEDPTHHSLKHHWQQTFPAGKTVIIEHTYKPAIGGTATHAEATAEEIKDYCIDSGTNNTINQLMKKREASGYERSWHWETLEYTLKTGASWKGPMGQLDLVIQKDLPDQIISLCFDGELKKSSATEFVFSKKNFEPKHDLKILYVTLSANE